MPQFDLYCYSTQAFWVILVFWLFFFFLISPLISLLFTIKVREKLKAFLLLSSTLSCGYTRATVESIIQ